MKASDVELPQTNDLRRIFLDDVALLDVRAPVEFAAGAFPHSINLPLLDNGQRHLVGIRYKEDGQDAAVRLGESLISGALRAERIGAWRDFARDNPGGMLYCFRGGQRSQISQRWLAEETGIRLPLIRGGYKAMRRFLIEQLQTPDVGYQLAVIGGRTGVGKTRLLRRFERFLDLEELAWHRGSAFGRHATPQPAQINFENCLAIALMKFADRGRTPIMVEDESRNIGSLHVPQPVFERIAAADLYILEATLEERVQFTRKEYVHDALAEYQHLLGDAAGFDAWADYLVDSLDRIRRRLGGDRHTGLRNALLSAIERQRIDGDASMHDAWIAPLLTEYYDPMYDYQLRNTKHRVRFAGPASELAPYLDGIAHQAA